MSIDLQNKYGETPLHTCSGQAKNPDMAKFLLLKGASPGIKNSLGDSPLGIVFILVDFLDLAKRYGNMDLVLMFSA